MKNIKVLIVDDHTLVREGIRAMLGIIPDIEIVGEASNGKEALAKIRDLLPDIVLMDLAMPIMGGLEATRRIHKTFPSVKVLALTQYDDNEYVIPLIEAGAKGFITKMAAFSELSTAIRAIYQGKSYLSPSAAAALVEDRQTKTSLTNANAEPTADPLHTLTDREREIFKLIIEGHTNREIAEMLIISTKTVEWHRSSLMRKLKLRNSTELIKFALRKSIISL